MIFWWIFSCGGNFESAAGSARRLPDGKFSMNFLFIRPSTKIDQKTKTKTKLVPDVVWNYDDLANPYPETVRLYRQHNSDVDLTDKEIQRITAG